MRKKKVRVPDNPPCHKSMRTMGKLNELRLKLLCYPAHSPDLASVTTADLKRMLQGKRWGSKEEVLVEVETYFENKDKASTK